MPWRHTGGRSPPAPRFSASQRTTDEGSLPTGSSGLCALCLGQSDLSCGRWTRASCLRLRKHVPESRRVRITHHCPFDVSFIFLSRRWVPCPRLRGHVLSLPTLPRWLGTAGDSAAPRAAGVYRVGATSSRRASHRPKASISLAYTVEAAMRMEHSFGGDSDKETPFYGCASRGRSKAMSGNRISRITMMARAIRNGMEPRKIVSRGTSRSIPLTT